MGTYNIHAGHGISGRQGCGAVGILDESNEARKVKDELIRLLQTAGNTVYDCTYEGSASQNTILSEIVKKCNAHKVDLDISIHLNSGRNDYAGDNSTGGVEVYGYDTNVKDTGNKICNNISDALGIRNRGFKTTKNLYVLNNTKSKAILIECCFVDDKDDSDRWDTSKCARAICQALGYNPNGYTNATPDLTKSEYINYRGHVQGIGWDVVKTNGQTVGTVGKSKRLEAIKIDCPTRKIEAKAHIQSVGDVNYGIIDSNTVIGTTGQSKRLEAIWLKGAIQFRVHIQSKGWTDWVNATNGAELGTKGQSKRIEAIEIKLL